MLRSSLCDYSDAYILVSGTITITGGPEDAALTAKKMKFPIKDFFSKCDQIRRNLRIWSHLLKKSLMENFIFCAVRGEWDCEF